MANLSARKKRLLGILLTAVVLIAATVGLAVGINNSRKKHSDDQHAEIQISSAAAHAVVKSSCSSTLYPELCYSTLATNFPKLNKKVRNVKDVIEMSLNITITTVEHNYFAIKKLTSKKDLTKREKVALHDCLETIDETLDELREAEADLQAYPTKKSLKQHAEDLKTLLSSAITNQETCLDGFSHDDADKKVRKTLEKGEIHVEKLCSNVLAMIKNMTDTDIVNEMKLTGGRRLKEEDETASGWPEWLSAGDRKLLQSPSVTPNVVVAADGSGNYRTVSAAVAAAPERSTRRYIIRIKAGVYRENVEVPKKKSNIMFVGDGRANTIITGSRNVVDGSTTFHSATVGEFPFFFHSHLLFIPFFYFFKKIIIFSNYLRITV